VAPKHPGRGGLTSLSEWVSRPKLCVVMVLLLGLTGSRRRVEAGRQRCRATEEEDYDEKGDLRSARADVCRKPNTRVTQGTSDIVLLAESGRGR